ncbi:MAG: hypothetical protein INF43_05230 [Alphaproteobacteria bacterium]|nr:hypothetical protein [Alphaproteobacteria bacterium]
MPFAVSANEKIVDVREAAAGEVSSKNLTDQLDLLKGKLRDAQNKLTAIGQCHSNYQLYVTRNGTPQCWSPVLTFYSTPTTPLPPGPPPPPPFSPPPPPLSPPPPPGSCDVGYVWTGSYCAYCPPTAGYVWNGSYCVYNQLNSHDQPRGEPGDAGTGGDGDADGGDGDGGDGG